MAIHLRAVGGNGTEDKTNESILLQIPCTGRITALGLTDASERLK
jgi:hypothetical protein